MSSMKKTKAQISYNMFRVRGKGSQIERLLEHQLRKQKIKYRRHYGIFGKPDFVILDKRTAIFCDSHFWHGHNWNVQKKDLKKNKAFWLKKIAANIDRDKIVNKTLRRAGWKVFRFWEHEIIKNPEGCITKIKRSSRIK